MNHVSVPKEYQALLSRWCAERVPEPARSRLQVGYRIHEDLITIVERRPPAYPELQSAWSTTPVAQLRHNDPEKGLWRIYLPTGGAEPGWKRYDHPPAATLDPLLAEITADPAARFWG
jgi:hypothetical protein